MMKMDVAIIGAGPSGATAAFHLAKNGFQVVLIEKEMLPRYKTCGGGLVTRGRDLLPFNIESAVETTFSKVETYFANTSINLTSSRTFPIISMVMRDEFDHLLCSQASKEGVKILQGEKLISFEKRGDKIYLTTTNQQLQVDFVIAADGALGQTAKLAGWAKETRHLIPALEYEIKVSEADWNRLSQSTRFDIDAIPNGYAWSFPKKNHLSIGVATVKRKKIDLKAHYQNYLQTLGITQIIEEQAHGFQIPISPRTDGFVKNNCLLIGDAAGFADPITFEGISNAIYSGKLAAESIIESKSSTENIEKIYQNKLALKLLPELTTAAFLGNFFYSQRSIRNLLIQKSGDRYSDFFTSIFTGEKSYPKNYLQTVRKKIFQRMLKE